MLEYGGNLIFTSVLLVVFKKLWQEWLLTLIDLKLCGFLVLVVLTEEVASSVASAITKYHTTQTIRSVIDDAMDIHGGKGICMGPNNYLAQLYMETPIGITVEGANILTRSMIIFGQGAVRCHPYVFKEMRAVLNNNAASIKEFDNAFFLAFWNGF